MARLMPGRLGLRMWLAPAVPILTLWACIATYNALEFRHAQEMAQMRDLAALAGWVGSVTHEVEKERLAQATASGIATQVKLTDQRRQEFTAAAAGLRNLAPELAAATASAGQALDGLPAIRSSAMGPEAAVAAYAPVVASLLTVQETAARLPADAQGLATMSALVAIERAKEISTRQHALGATGTAAQRLEAEQAGWLAAFHLHATPAQAAVLDAAPPHPGPGRREALQAVAGKVAVDLGQHAERAADEVVTTLWTFNIAMIGAAVLGGLVVVVLVQGLTGPLTRMAAIMRALARGDTAHKIPETERADEIGEMARALAVFKDNAVAVLAMTAEQESLKATAEDSRRRSLCDMADKVESETAAVVSRVAEESRRVREVATAMAGSARTVGENSQGVAEAARIAMDNVHVVAGAADQLSTAIRQIADEMDHSAQVVGTAVDATRKSTDIMTRLVAAAGQIDEVVAMIAEIASQTNLLALNASIEAQRAGNAGKGFAVVANEVKRLASVTATQTEEISRRIADMQAIAGSAAEAFREVDTAMTEVHAISGAVRDAVARQDAATKEIARNVAETSSAAGEVTTRITEVAAEASATGDRAGEVRALLDAMAKEVAQLSHRLTAVVRNATPDVNRRNRQRIEINEPALITIDGFPMPGTLLDLSPTAARIDSMPTMPVGTIGTMMWNNLDIPISVTAQENGVTRLMVRSGWEDAGKLLQLVEERG